MYLGRGYHETGGMEGEMANNESPLVIKHPETTQSVRSMRIVVTFAQ